MKLATLNNGSRDGQLIVVNKHGSRCVTVEHICLTMQEALDDWENIAPQLEETYDELNKNIPPDILPVDTTKLLAPLTRAYQFLDGSAYLAHVERVRKARGAEMPPSFLKDPLMYQATSDCFLAPSADIEVTSEDYGIDFESEVAVIVDDVPMNVSVEDLSLIHI